MSKIAIFVFYYINYSKNPVETVEINKIKRGPANSSGFDVHQLPFGISAMLLSVFSLIGFGDDGVAVVSFS